MSRIEKIGNATLYLGDCRDILPMLPKVDLVLTDPPYGIGWDRQAEKDSGRKPGSSAATKRIYVASGWDDEPMSAEFGSQIAGKANHSIFWGGNFYGLPAAKCWLVWDKQTGENKFSDCELAWTSFDMPIRKFTWMWNGMLRQGGEERNGHPTQKPLALMEWCINLAPKTTSTVADPFAGSGTTGVACANLGKTFYGIEREPKYFDIACKRIENAYRQQRLFA